MTPPAALLEAPNHGEANRIAKSNGWPGISAQAFALGPKILEVQPVALRDLRVHEVHPEVSFVAANEGRHLRWSKSFWNGASLRRRILDRQGIEVPDDLGPAGEVAPADILDASVAPWSAYRISSGSAASFPDRSERIGSIWF